MPVKHAFVSAVSDGAVSSQVQPSNWNADHSIVTDMNPDTSDGAALGSITKMWSDLFLASGAVVNWNNGDVTSTHSANTLAFAGASSGYSFDSLVNVPTLNLGTAGGTIGTLTLSGNTSGTVTIRPLAAAGTYTLTLPNTDGDPSQFLQTDGSGNLTWAAGGGGNPGGSTLQLQYNNASAFGGMAGTSWDDTNRSLTLTGATVTTSKPVFDLSQTWSAGGVTFTALKLNVTNTASAAASLLMDLQVGASSKFSVVNDGQVKSTKGYSATAPAFTIGTNDGIASSGGNLFWVTGGQSRGLLDGAGGVLSVNSTFAWAWSSGNVDAQASDLFLYRDAARTLAQRDGTNANTYRLYNSWSNSGTDYERFAATWSSNVLYLKNESGGSGTLRLMVPVTGSTTVSALPSASTAGAGARLFVTDANATTFLSTVAGGGSNKVPVVSDGTNWLIG